MIGGWVASDRAELGDRHGRVGKQLEQERLEIVVGAIDLVDQQHRGAGAGMFECAKQGPLNQVIGAEQLFLVERAPAGVGEPDAEQLAGVVPLIQRLGRIDPLVALQADQRRIEHGRQRQRRLGLADSRLALEQQRLGQPEAEEDRGRQTLIDEVVDRGESLGERLDVGDDPSDLGRRLPALPLRAHAAHRGASSSRTAR